MTLAIILFIFGLAIGSFFNVCIYRIPRNKSLVFPASHCPNCKKPISPYDNIPVLSYLILKGKCRNCKKSISIRYPIVELLTALFFATAAFKFGPTIPLLRAIIFLSFLLIVTFIDLEYQIAPFRITIPAVILGLVSSFFLPEFVSNYIIGMLLGALFVILVWILWRYLLSDVFQAAMGIKQKEGIGWGDLPLIAMIGVFLGWRLLIVAIFAAVVCGVIIGLILRIIKRNKPGQPIAFGPFLALGSLISLFFGKSIIYWYLNRFL